MERSSGLEQGNANLFRGANRFAILRCDRNLLPHCEAQIGGIVNAQAVGCCQQNSFMKNLGPRGNLWVGLLATGSRSGESIMS